MPSGSPKEIQYVVNSNGCHICTSHSLDTDGYPKFTRQLKTLRISRHVYRTIKGEIPADMVVRHTCDDRRCINPDHLLLGTTQDNINDKISRGRQRAARGEAAGSAKLNASQVLEIYTSPEKQVVLVKRYRISATVVSMIKNGLIWKSVTQPIIEHFKTKIPA